MQIDTKFIYINIIYYYYEENLQTGCRGNSSLCASDATAACTIKINTSALLCECAYVTGLENLPPCESEDNGK